jgi:hypothetical protein
MDTLLQNYANAALRVAAMSIRQTIHNAGFMRGAAPRLKAPSFLCESQNGVL